MDDILCVAEEEEYVEAMFLIYPEPPRIIRTYAIGNMDPLRLVIA